MHLVHGTNGIVEQLMRAVFIIQKFPEVTRECFQPGTPAQDFIHKIWKQRNPDEISGYTRIGDNCYAVGYLKADKKCGSGLMKKDHYDAVVLAKQQPLGHLATYDRMMIHGTMYHSVAYKRVTRHNSYTVVFGEEGRVEKVYQTDKIQCCGATFQATKLLFDK
ncbi:hypothetical protein Bbelb_110300 [Branchiostoma belcheri]|nr:hypothetical protein Bbelb_110300 [Branchiostoma belcheri]